MGRASPNIISGKAATDKGGAQVASLHDLKSTCDLCGEEADSEVTEVVALDCSYAQCPAECELFHQSCVEKYLKTLKLERNRKTGFVCPRGASSKTRFPGAPCKGKIQKSHPVSRRSEGNKARRQDAHEKKEAAPAPAAPPPPKPKPAKRPAPAEPAAKGKGTAAALAAPPPTAAQKARDANALLAAERDRIRAQLAARLGTAGPAKPPPPRAAAEPPPPRLRTLDEYEAERAGAASAASSRSAGAGAERAGSAAAPAGPNPWASRVSSAAAAGEAAEGGAPAPAPGAWPDTGSPAPSSRAPASEAESAPDDAAAGGGGLAGAAADGPALSKAQRKNLRRAEKKAAAKAEAEPSAGGSEAGGDGGGGGAAADVFEACMAAVVQRRLQTQVAALEDVGFAPAAAAAAVRDAGGDLEAALAALLAAGGGAPAPVGAAGWGAPEVDVSAELAEMAELRGRYGLNAGVVEAVVVNCGGDVSMAAALLEEQCGGGGGAAPPPALPLADAWAPAAAAAPYGDAAPERAPSPYGYAADSPAGAATPAPAAAPPSVFVSYDSAAAGTPGGGGGLWGAPPALDGSLLAMLGMGGGDGVGGDGLYGGAFGGQERAAAAAQAPLFADYGYAEPAAAQQEWAAPPADVAALWGAAPAPAQSEADAISALMATLMAR